MSKQLLVTIEPLQNEIKIKVEFDTIASIEVPLRVTYTISKKYLHKSKKRLFDIPIQLFLSIFDLYFNKKYGSIRIQSSEKYGEVTIELDSGDYHLEVVWRKTMYRWITVKRKFSIQIGGGV